ncbi:MFS sugar transporter-like protein [Aureobasidium sp. EXF-12298]|nr:MFS sugar transporter-like protein [Aureobasidium sp. EXF-12298]KAI4757972.1 MFS sugar transporter-like protein [Aureobasidium sp. EXF-12344]KAI4775157.1 MFS sugar transporter-like protein [Aureobasidium sp. EXF-3400]
MKDADIVGQSLAEVLPQTNKYWFQHKHLLHLNLLLLVPLISSSVAGYDGSLMNGLQSLPQWRDYFGNPVETKLGLVNAAQSIGSVILLPIVSWASDRWGRRLVLLAGIIGVISATIIQATSTTLAQLVVSRLMVGAAGMFVVQPAPMLIAELAYPTHRGKYTSAFWTMYYLGAILASWTCFGCESVQSNWAWRIPTIMQAAYPLIQAAFWIWVPESPRWLVAQDRAPEAMAIIAKYHAGGDLDSPLVVREMGEIVDAIRLEKETKTPGWGALVETPGNRKRLFIAIFLGAAAQWNGIGVVSYYLTLVLDSVGITDSFTQTLINGLLQIFNFGAALSAAFLVDRLGRRTLFIWSGFGMLVSYIVWTACSAVNSIDGSKPAGIVVITEIFPYSLRSKGLTCELLSIYMSLVIAAFTNPIGLENLGWKYYIVFCCFLVVILAVTFCTFPETKGFSLEEIVQIFDGPQAARDVEKSEKEVKKGFEVEATEKIERV